MKTDHSIVTNSITTEPFRSIVNHSIDGVIMVDLNGKVKFINPAAASLLGVTRLEFLNRDFGLPLLSSELIELDLVSKLGIKRIVEMRVSEEIWEKEKTFALSLRDITKRKQNERTIQKARDNLEIKIEQRTVELKASNKELENALEELQSLDKMKDDFLATVSHELRTPLASILGYAEIIKDCDVVDIDRENFVEIIIQETERLSMLIESVLDLSGLSHGKLAFTFIDTDFDPIIEIALRSVRGLLVDRKNLNIHFHPSGVRFKGDRERISQVVINLLSNAIKFSPEKGKIEISVEKNETDFILSVKDEGRGIPKDSLDKIFNKFHQIDREKSTLKGTGLGLSISKAIILGHDGTIWVENNDKGATFKFSIPYFQSNAVRKNGLGR